MFFFSAQWQNCDRLESPLKSQRPGNLHSDRPSPLKPDPAEASYDLGHGDAKPALCQRFPPLRASKIFRRIYVQMDELPREIVAIW
jgi:hypothetical protein